ncbi:hypothetical protein HNY73_021607 [Argiope bruennichi]|uniref:Uncharacterized protein n=1 Tax=Argiope bruennichi TaxID=94029 RepID=A0A8T0E1S7_ARGBR|nr:hypothetical protein HNY73_021607 [Argiope bruennichi]
MKPSQLTSTSSHLQEIASVGSGLSFNHNHCFVERDSILFRKTVDHNGEESREKLEDGSEGLETPYPISDPNVYGFEGIIRDSALEDRLSSLEMDAMRKLIDRYQRVFSNELEKRT